MLHEVTDSEGDPEDEFEERFNDCYEVEDEVIAHIYNHDEFRDEDVVWGLPEIKEPANLSFNEMDQPKVLPHIHDAKNLTVECEQNDLLHWHYHLGHSAFKMLKALAIIRILPHCLAKTHTPMCPAYSFAKMYQNHVKPKVSTREALARE